MKEFDLHELMASGRHTRTWFLTFFIMVYFMGHGQQKIEGRVIDRETGKPVPFASVGVLGTASGTSSNLEGEFSLAIPEGAKLKISCVGYVSLVVNTPEEMRLIQLTPFTIELNEIVVTHRTINARRVVLKAFSNINRNYSGKSFNQQYFYRHYCKDDSVYGRLIEAFIDVWKYQGYKPFRKKAGEKEEMRVTQLRRSLDNTIAAQGHTPISLHSILQNDIVAYQLLEKSNYLSLYTDISNLRTDFENFTFTFDGITAFDGRDVYKISYHYKEDSIPTTAGYKPAPRAKGMLYITTDTYAFVKAEEVKYDENVTIKTSAFYRKYNDKYYPYHFIREGETHFTDSGRHSFHIELMSVQIQQEPDKKFTGKEPTKKELLNIPYDSSFWNNTTVLKATPLEDRIIRDLGGGSSLNRQFFRYLHYAWSTTDGSNQAEEKFNWLRNDSKGKRMLYLMFWSGDLKPYLVDVELFKRLNKQFHEKINFVLICLDEEQEAWKRSVATFNLFADGIVNYRVERGARMLKEFEIQNLPSFVLIHTDGEKIDLKPRRPSDSMLEADLKELLREYQ